MSPASRAHAALAPGTILIVDFDAGTNDAGILFTVNPANGVRTALSDFSDAGQGPTGQSPFGVASLDIDTILVLDNQGVSGHGVIFAVDDATGARAILSDFANATQGPLGLDPVGIALVSGSIWVTDRDAGTNGDGALFRVNPTTGARRLVSDFGDPTKGPTGMTPTGVSRGINGSILVVDPDGGTNSNGALFSVNRSSGVRTLISDFGDAAQGTTGLNPGGVMLGSGGVILVADTEGGTGSAGVLFTVNPITGARSILSTFGNAGQGATGLDPFFVAIGLGGDILVTDDAGGTDIPMDGHVGGNGALFTVDPANGNRVLISDFGNPAKGPTGVDPVGVAIVPAMRTGDLITVSTNGGTSLAGAVMSVHPTSGMRVQVSDFGNDKQGPGGANPFNVAIGLNGDVYVVDAAAGGAGQLFRLDPVSGARSVLTSFNVPSQGPTAIFPAGVALGAGGAVLVATLQGGTGNKGALFSVDPLTGMRTVLSDFGNASQGPLGNDPDGVEQRSDGQILVLDDDGPSGVHGAMYVVDPVSGARTLLSDFNLSSQGPLGIQPTDLAQRPDGAVLVADGADGLLSVLFVVDPVTGFRTVLSDFENPAQGPTSNNPFGVTITSGGGIAVVDLAAGTASRGALYSVNPTTGVRTMLSDFGNASQGPLDSGPQGVTVFVEEDCVTVSDCDDGDTCTTDSCDALLGCTHQLPPVPLEVQDLMVTPAGGSAANISWSPTAGADFYRAYFGGNSSFTTISCLEPQVSGTSTTDIGAGSPTPGNTLFYLATAVNCGGGGTLGYRSDGMQRTITNPCP